LIACRNPTLAAKQLLPTGIRAGPGIAPPLREHLAADGAGDGHDCSEIVKGMRLQGGDFPVERLVMRRDQIKAGMFRFGAEVSSPPLLGLQPPTARRAGAELPPSPAPARFNAKACATRSRARGARPRSPGSST